MITLSVSGDQILYFWRKIVLLTRNQVESFIPNSREEFDVIVCGGGPAGIGAALAARHCGVKTLVLEAESTFGGVAMMGMWMPFNRIVLDGVTALGGKRGGVFDKFVAAIKKYGPEAASNYRHPVTDQRGGFNIHPEYLRLAVFDLFEAAGCKYRLYSPVFGVEKLGDSVIGVKVTTKDGKLETFKGKVIIDCTGDGDVSFYAGVETMKGREEDGRFLPPSLLWALSGVDTKKFFEYRWEHEDEYKAMLEEYKAEGNQTSSWFYFEECSVPNTINVNNGGVQEAGNVDMTSERDMTMIERLGIQMVMDFNNFVRRKKVPGLENAYLMRAGARVAVRDTRRIVGEYLITHDDAIKGTEFDDIVSRKYGFVDAVGYFVDDMVSGHAYPYRCLVPKNVNGLLVAGRCAAATHLGFASGRGMGENMGMGQAAGVAAAVSIDQGVQPRDVNVKKVQEIIRATGVRL
jgi:hypothetical protein